MDFDFVVLGVRCPSAGVLEKKTAPELLAFLTSGLRDRDGDPRTVLSKIETARRLETLKNLGCDTSKI